MARPETTGKTPAPSSPASCDRCAIVATEFTQVETVGGAALCSFCQNDLSVMPIIDYMNDIFRWKKRPEMAGKIWSVLHG